MSAKGSPGAAWTRKKVMVVVSQTMNTPCANRFKTMRAMCEPRYDGAPKRATMRQLLPDATFRQVTAPNLIVPAVPQSLLTGTWRTLLTPPMTGAANMALDHALME